MNDKKTGKEDKSARHSKSLKRHKESLGTVPSQYIGDNKSLKTFLLSVDKITRSTSRRDATRTLREFAEKTCQAVLKEDLNLDTTRIEGENKKETLTKVHLLLKQYRKCLYLNTLQRGTLLCLHIL